MIVNEKNTAKSLNEQHQQEQQPPEQALATDLPDSEHNQSVTWPVPMKMTRLPHYMQTQKRNCFCNETEIS
ncbi:hypothetical protein [Desulfoplanes formicivorans]|uniref:Uncharacterized protein n=1 Tax=Desulfoplanes formicivorans TaxID=1592317 RepID=A0A194AKJ7_9BACT|nr:hypothetical protein [Desulfoplanes formicivorans]GAU09838.1 hypothetical protein DPF_2574 [Desulfoplanes formicivorans]